MRERMQAVSFHFRKLLVKVNNFSGKSFFKRCRDVLIYLLDADVRLGSAGWKFSHVCTEMNPCALSCLQSIFGVMPHASPSAPGEILHVVPKKTVGGDSVCMRGFNQLSVNVFFPWLLTFDSSPPRPFSIVRTLRVADKSLPISGLSPAHGSMPLSACHRSCLRPATRQQINPSKEHHTVWWCFSLTSFMYPPHSCFLLTNILAVYWCVYAMLFNV